jgi:hypothetical protein
MKTRIEEAAQTINLTDANASPMDIARALHADGHLMPDLPGPDMAHDDPEWQHKGVPPGATSLISPLNCLRVRFS